MNMKKYHQIYYLKISSNFLFENIIKFVFFAILVAFICDGGAGRVRWVVGGGGAGEGAGGRRWRWSGGRVRGVLGSEGGLARGIAIEREGDRDRVSS